MGMQVIYFKPKYFSKSKIPNTLESHATITNKQKDVHTNRKQHN